MCKVKLSLKSVHKTNTLIIIRLGSTEVLTQVVCVLVNCTSKPWDIAFTSASCILSERTSRSIVSRAVDQQGQAFCSAPVLKK